MSSIQPQSETYFGVAYAKDVGITVLEERKEVVSRQIVDSKLAAELRELNLTHLSLRHCPDITDWSFLHEGMQSLLFENISCKSRIFPTALPPNLKELVLRTNLSPTRIGWPHEGRLMAQLKQLTTLELRLCRMTEAHFDAGLFLLPRTLQHLNLSENCLPDISFMSYSNIPNLISLNLSDCHIGSHAIQNLAKKLPQLESLDLSYNELGATGAERLLRLVQTNPKKHNLMHLNLECCWLGQQGARYVALLMTAVQTTLQSLNVTDNAFNDSGVNTILESATNPLRRLHLGKNNMTNVGAINLAKCIATLPSLEHIHLQGNMSIQTVGWLAIAHAVAANPRIQTVDTTQCSFLKWCRPWPSFDCILTSCARINSKRWYEKNARTTGRYCCTPLRPASPLNCSDTNRALACTGNKHVDSSLAKHSSCEQAGTLYFPF